MSTKVTEYYCFEGITPRTTFWWFYITNPTQYQMDVDIKDGLSCSDTYINAAIETIYALITLLNQ